MSVQRYDIRGSGSIVLPHVDGDYVLFTDYQQAVAERDAALVVLREMHKSAFPNPTENPSMFRAWSKAGALLAKPKP